MQHPVLRVVFVGTAPDAFLASLPPSIEVVRDRAAARPDLVVLLPDAEAAPPVSWDVPALRLSAADLLASPQRLEALLLKRPSWRRSPGPSARLIGDSAVMARVRGTLALTSRSALPLLITGENGTGKDLAAEVAHQLSPRAAEPFVAVNCGAVPAALAESEFFGSVRGAFTGAETRTGFCQQARGGTLFLDEIGELPLEIQSKLLRVLENHEVRRVGSPKVEEAEFRLICATNRDLAAGVKEGRFREDLYYRINVLPLRMPALRERLDDLPQLCEHFLDGAESGRGGRVRVGPAALNLLARQAWPGNLRQLRNVLLRAAVLHGSRELKPEDLDLDE